MATSIASGALKPKQAVALSAVLNLGGAFLSTAVAGTIAKDLVNGHLVTLQLVFAGLVGGIVWNLLTWLLGIPSSSSHALVGGIVGAMIAAAGAHGVIWTGVVSRVLIPALVSVVLAGDRRSGGHLAGVPDRSWCPGRAKRNRVPPRPDLLGLPRFAGTRHQRRTEDDGRHLPGADLIRRGQPDPSPAAVLGDLCLRVRNGGWARTPAAGGSSAPWARASSRSSRRRAWLLNPLLRSSFCCPPSSATRCRPRRWSPVRCSVAASANPAPRCAGESPAGWRPPG